MPVITYIEKTRTFFLEAAASTYAMRVREDGMLEHVYYGAPIGRDDLTHYYTHVNGNSCLIAPQEYGTIGRGDNRSPSIVVRTDDGRTVNELLYKEHRLVAGKPRFEGMPQLVAGIEDATTLEVVLEDAVDGYEVSLFYTVFEKENVIARRTEVRNVSQHPLTVLRIASAAVDLYGLEDYEVMSLDGAWIRERHINTRPVLPGVFMVESRSGISGHEHSPFTALVEQGATEHQGQVYGCVLVYSGDHRMSVEMDAFHSIRMTAGICPDTFSWQLLPGDSFTTPEALLTYSDRGLNGMSQGYHAVCRHYLGKCSQPDLVHPVVINTWESVSFGVNEQNVSQFIRNCEGLNFDIMVMDDGWFGRRNDDHTSLGDWFVNEEKFPRGLQPVIDLCHEYGMKFGIWVEPEMISRVSRLYEQHPDWCIHTPGRIPAEQRTQLVLDLTRPEVVDYVYDVISTLLSTYDIAYVKWDMNRLITDNGTEWLGADRQGEFNHRYILGVYDLMERITSAFPQVFFEGCAAGGARFDFGILYYMPQIWTSDNNDAIDRLKIQYGTSMVYPPFAMAAHVGAVPYWATGRTTPFEVRGDVALGCSFGYELNAGHLSAEDRAKINDQIAHHHRIEDMIDNGVFYRLLNPFEDDYCAWQLVSQDQSRSFVMVAQRAAQPNPRTRYLRLQGLESQRRYTLSATGQTFTGATLMHAGLPVPIYQRDYETRTFELTAE